MQHFRLSVPPVLAKLIAAHDFNPELIIENEILRMREIAAPMSLADVGRMIGEDGIYISGTGADAVIIHTVGSSNEVGRRLIALGKLLCQEDDSN